MPGDDEKIKSALEIALEKAEKLGAPSEEERQEARREELAATGEALAKRYLNGLPLRDLEVELAKLPDNDAEVVRRHLKSHLLEAIDLESPGRNDKALAAIQHLFSEAETVRSIGDLLQEYAGAVESARAQNLPALESAKMEELRQRGISGSAIEPSVESSPAWVRLRQQLSASYKAQIEEIKRRSLEASI
jgi:hypothetical protein